MRALDRWAAVLDEHAPGTAAGALGVDDDQRRARSGFLARVGADDDATLVLWAPGWPDLLERLPAVVAQLGLDGDDGPDMLGTAACEADLGPLLAAVAETVIGRPLPTAPAR